MNLLAALTEKPWEPSGIPQSQFLGREHTRRAGLKVLLTVVSVLFFLFIVAFLMRSQYPDWQPLAEQPNQPLFNKNQLWLNTLSLILASVFLQVARVSMRRNHSGLSQLGLILGGLFSCAFVAGQFVFWQHLYQQGFVINVNPALSFFYLLTGLHAVHVVIGLLAWLAAVFFAIGSKTEFNQVRLKHYVDLCAMYWHFLLALWGILFVLLVSKPDTYKAIAEFCGLGV
jgi:cytochrome c oxidase subunit 3